MSKTVIRRSSLQNKRGAEVVENVLMIAIVIALVIIVFYPQLTTIMEDCLTALEKWFLSAINSIGLPRS